MQQNTNETGIIKHNTQTLHVTTYLKCKHCRASLSFGQY